MPHNTALPFCPFCTVINALSVYTYPKGECLNCEKEFSIFKDSNDKYYTFKDDLDRIDLD